MALGVQTFDFEFYPGVKNTPSGIYSSKSSQVPSKDTGQLDYVLAVSGAAPGKPQGRNVDIQCQTEYGLYLYQGFPAEP